MSTGTVALQRGKYGPLPVDLVPPRARVSARRHALYAGLVGRHLAALRTVRKLDPDEVVIVSEAAAKARFTPWACDLALAGFRLATAELAPYSRDVVTLAFSAGDGRSFELVQRSRWLPLIEELTAACIPFERIPTVSPPLYVVNGKYGGEPIDGAFWSTRRAIQFELSDLSLELREVIGRGPGLSALIRFATAIRAAAGPQK